MPSDSGFYTHAVVAACRAIDVRLAGRSRLLEGPERIEQDVNRFLRGWAGYFRYGNAESQFTRITAYAAMRVGVLLWRAKRERLRRRPRRH